MSLQKYFIYIIAITSITCTTSNKNTYGNLPSGRSSSHDHILDSSYERGPKHNSYFWFRDNPDEKYIPMLLSGLYQLKRYDELTEKICTYGHALDALEACAKTDSPKSYSEWSKWYKNKYGKEFIPLTFPTKKP